MAEKKRLQEEQAAKARASQQKKQEAVKTVSKAPRGATISLFGLGQTNDNSSSAASAAPGGIPTISQWRQERDGSITGVISGSSAFKNGDPITTSPIRGNAVGGSTVTTKSGSKYFLSDNGTPANNAKADQQAAAAEKKRLAEEKKAQQLEARRQAEEQRKQAAAAVAEKKRIESEKRAEAQLKKKKEQEAKALQAAKKQQAQAAVSQAKKGSTISLFGFGGGSDDSQTSASTASVKKSPTIQLQPPPKKAPTQQIKKATTAPNGIPTISGWKLNGDGSISGRISGSTNFKQGELITTSPISSGRIDSGSVVQTVSGSKYFLS